jgi:hypothetical protein
MQAKLLYSRAVEYTYSENKMHVDLLRMDELKEVVLLFNFS